MAGGLRNSLPVFVEPGDDESVVSHMERVAHAHGLNARDLAQWVGAADRRGSLPASLPLGMADDDIDTYARATLLHPERVRAMTLMAWSGTVFDGSGLAWASPTTVGKTRVKEWVRSSWSPWCPECLGVDGWWRVRWRLPWEPVCGRHGTLLTGSCPSCGGRGQQRLAALSDPPRAARFCGNLDSGEVCGADLSVVEPTPAALTPEMASGLALVRQALAGEQVTAVGADVSPLEFFDGLRLLATAVLKAGTTTAATSVAGPAGDAALAVARLRASRRKAASGNPVDDIDPAAVLAYLHVLEPVVAATTPAEADAAYLAAFGAAKPGGTVDRNLRCPAWVLGVMAERSTHLRQEPTRYA